MSVPATPYSLLSQWGMSPLVPGTVPQPGPSAMSSPPKNLPVVALHVENFLTKAGTAHTQLHTQVARSSQEMKLLPRNHDYLKDKYSNCDSDNLVNFTTDYFEYEQDQKPIIVKYRIKQNVDFWKALAAGNLILDTFLNGYKIPYKICLQNNTLILSIKP